MQCYSELTKPTAVTCSICLPFLSPSANNLIVAKTSLLQIFSLKSVISAADDFTSTQQTQAGQQGLASSRPDRSQTTKFFLIAEFELAGAITSLARIKILRSKSGGEALLVGLRDAKLSLIEWDPACYSISTISIHYYEREDILSSPWDTDLSRCPTILSVDPSSRCAVFKFGKRHIAIIPFHQPGDDIVMDDYDPDLDGEKLERKTSFTKANENGEHSSKTPYAASFVLSLLALDSTLKNPIDLAFLYEYREPTFGILSSETATSSSLLQDRRDVVSYAVYNLDLDQRASTTLLSVTNLPYDLHTILPLSRAIGGALLIGANELIHVDQSGKTNGVAVNEATKYCTSFALSDQSDLDLRLEHCLIKQLGFDSPEILIIEPDGGLLILSFKLDGRSVSSLSLRRVDASPLTGRGSCASSIGRGRLFIGSEETDSVILGWSRPSDKLKRQRSRIETKVEEEELTDIDNLDFDEDEDDLYADDKPNETTKAAGSPSTTVSDLAYTFRVHDHLSNMGPAVDLAFGQCQSNLADEGSAQDELILPAGQGRSGCLLAVQTAVAPRTNLCIPVPGVKSIWTVSPRKTAQAGSTAADSPDQYVIAVIDDESMEAKTKIYSIDDDNLREIENTDFDSEAGAAVECGTLNNGTRFVQVLPKEVRTYDADFGLAQILELDEDNVSDAQVKAASFADPYVLLVKDDQSISVLAADESGDLEELQQGSTMKEGKWSSGSLYDDANDILQLEFSEEDEASNILLFMLTSNGGLQIYRLPGLDKPVFSADGLSFLPPFLSSDFTVRRSTARAILSELLVAELGDGVNRAPYIFLRTAVDDLIIYQPYQAPIEGSKDTTLRLLKVPNAYFALSEDEPEDEPNIKVEEPLRALPDLNGYSAVWLPGSPSHMIIKPTSCQPSLFPLAAESIHRLYPAHTSRTPHGFIYISSPDNLTFATLSDSQSYNTGLPVTRIPIGQTVNAVSYHASSQSYILSLLSPTPFKLPSDPSLRAAVPESEPLLPTTDQSTLALFDRSTTTIIQTRPLDPYEVVLCLSTVELEISEQTHERRSLVCVGTSINRGEDLAAIGHIYVFAVIDVVPDPERPETGKALKLVCKEEVKGAVTALGPVGTQGLLMVAQGQKVLVRGLKEDGSLLPVAFLDTQVQTSVCKELKGSNLIVVGDVVGGVWFVGFTEDPYQLRLFAKSPYKFDVVTANFLPDGPNLYIVAVDSDGGIHVLQYDPESEPPYLPRSLPPPLLTFSHPIPQPPSSKSIDIPANLLLSSQ